MNYEHKTIHTETGEKCVNTADVRDGCGRIFSEEHRRKISESHKGKRFSEETRKKMSESLKGEKHPNFGKHHSAETRRKMSEAHKRIKSNHAV